MTTAQLAVSSPPAGIDEPLAPLRAALLSRARRDAQAVLAAADADAAAVVTDAEREAAGIRATAAAAADVDAKAILGAKQSQTRRQARGIDMRARRAGYDSLREAAHCAVTAMVDDALRERLITAVRARSGPDATITAEPDGLVADYPGRRVSYRVMPLADRALDALLAAREEP